MIELGPKTVIGKDFRGIENIMAGEQERSYNLAVIL